MGGCWSLSCADVGFAGELMRMLQAPVHTGESIRGRVGLATMDFFTVRVLALTR